MNSEEHEGRNTVSGVRRPRGGRCPAFTVATLTACLLTGCSSKPSGLPEVAPVTGTITMDGQPLPSVTVVFESQSGHSAFGSTDATGRYELVAAGNQRGAIVGPNKVMISSQLDAPPDPRWKDPIPARYNAATELTADVVAGKNKFDFSLKGK